MKKLNKKGFTLVELLAVIVILALLMVVATSSIGGALTNAKKNTLKTEAQKMLTNFYQEAKSSYMLSNNFNNMSATSHPAASSGKIFVYDDEKYHGYFLISSSNALTTYCIWDESNSLSIYKTGLSYSVNNSDSGSSLTVASDAIYSTGTSVCKLASPAAGSSYYSITAGS